MVTAKTFEEWWNSVKHTPAITKADYGSDSPTEDVCRLSWEAATQASDDIKHIIERSYNSNYAKCNQPKPSLCEKRNVVVYCTHDKDCTFKHFTQSQTVVGNNF